ncbi:MAG: hypothetical protein HQK81_06735 [Desulfovibrionaceae bacterium]|nr:hypothetical protein [Desulfovibrionaceae bacterium]MBF0513746.1 hypothetical protein [Desulfovibrionaceae bacterium]
MTRLFQGILGIFLTRPAAKPTKPLSRFYDPGGLLADPVFHSRYRDQLAIFESALINADLPALDAAAAKLTRMQDDCLAPAGRLRPSGEPS